MWHVDPEETDKKEKTAAALAESRVSDDLAAQPTPGELLDGAVLRGLDLEAEISFRDVRLRGADLRGADLRGADLLGADLSGATLYDADLSGATLYDADLSGATLGSADLSGATLGSADLSGATLVDADLSGAILVDADLSGADLRHADLSEADLRGAVLRTANIAEATLTGVSFARGTIVENHRAAILNEYGADDARPDTILPQHSPEVYDRIARVEHELRTAYSDNGLTGRARRARVRERKARRREAFAEGGRGRLAWLWSVFAQVSTGYGIQLRWIGGVMLALYLAAVLVYWQAGGLSLPRSLYYSVVTFTTSPPTPPAELRFGRLATTMAGVETFAGTAAIVFLGYVLGTRERV